MNDSALNYAVGYLPDRISRELCGVMRGSRLSVREIRLRSFGVCEVVTDGGSFPLLSRIDGYGMEKTVKRLCRGSPYAYIESIKSGYIPLSHGVRVGIVGEARYEGQRLVGISEISALNFRIPTALSNFAEGLYREWLATRGNLLILAPPSGGKTTALRSLARLIGTGRDARRVVVVDERCEFNPADYENSLVDILQGYRRGIGTEVAVRTMSPEVLLVDEISSTSDADALRSAVGVGVPIIATAHGTEPRSLLMRKPIAKLLYDGCFSHYSVIRAAGGGFVISPLSEIKI